MPIENRNAAPGGYEAAVAVLATAFMERPDHRADADSIRANWDPDRVWLAVDTDRVVGTFRSFATYRTLPGGRAPPASAVSAVTVLPTHRRRGIMTGLAASGHGALRERGEAVALLYAADFGIYGRFGYAPGTRQVEDRIDPRATRFRGEPTGTDELVPATTGSRAAKAADGYVRWKAEPKWERKLPIGVVEFNELMPIRALLMTTPPASARP